jgi:hypothetical protein
MDSGANGFWFNLAVYSSEWSGSPSPSAEGSATRGTWYLPSGSNTATLIYNTYYVTTLDYFNAAGVVTLFSAMPYYEGGSPDNALQFSLHLPFTSTSGLSVTYPIAAYAYHNCQGSHADASSYFWLDCGEYETTSYAQVGDCMFKSSTWTGGTIYGYPLPSGAIACKAIATQLTTGTYAYQIWVLGEPQATSTTSTIYFTQTTTSGSSYSGWSSIVTSPANTMWKGYCLNTMPVPSPSPTPSITGPATPSITITPSYSTGTY